jgi:hypothetical protein
LLGIRCATLAVSAIGGFVVAILTGCLGPLGLIASGFAGAVAGGVLGYIVEKHLE